ncbi:MAG TPA: hypothetical protein VIG52_05170 [Methyloceanibacter sp.]|jgi:hypothetical protein
MLTMLKMSLVMVATTIAILAGDYCYKQTLVQPGDESTASIQVARSGS